jgi:hypothetical protein
MPIPDGLTWTRVGIHTFELKFTAGNHINPSDNYRSLCKLEADASFLRLQQPRKNQNGSSGEHREFHCTFVLWFSETELRAQLVWKEDVGAFGFDLGLETTLLIQFIRFFPLNRERKDGT